VGGTFSLPDLSYEAARRHELSIACGSVSNYGAEAADVGSDPLVVCLFKHEADELAQALVDGLDLVGGGRLALLLGHIEDDETRQFVCAHWG